MRPFELISHLFIRIVCGCIFIGVPLYAQQSLLYVFYPSTIRPQTLQKKLTDELPGVSVMVFGRYIDFADDTVFVPAMQLKVGSPVEIGTYTKSATAYTLSPSSCADTSGRMSAANCSTPVQTATITGNTVVIPAFFGGLLDLVMTKR